ncbi:MAG: hypothetical protein GWO20_13255 [Candidatus Korarchaeota archaeon]|nr:hypothetical protein [Candidatus Korarchaeota archaeon]NIU84362.1 hypothetical protein [Candidatus Thorarchaeota archaeon]NIW14478.1 hypothetical protein [Candidatus Thorarchaeota archaeon]NIW52555.1 hypothetical protein [Candidatus Korarchaeota archaeon]
MEDVLSQLNFGDLCLLFGSTIISKMTTSFRKLGSRVGGIFSKSTTSPSLTLIERKRKVTPEIDELKEVLRGLKRGFHPPRPEITVFRLGERKFHPYSTSEAEERFKSSYWAYLASLYAAGRNITRFLKARSEDLSDFSLQGSEMYNLLLLGGVTRYIGRLQGSTLFSIKSEKFPRERFKPPRERTWMEYSFDDVQMFIDRQMDFILRGEQWEGGYPQLAELIRLSYHTGVKTLQKIQSGENFAIYLLKTPQSRLSPFITIRVEGSERQISSHLFPVWFAYDELQLIRAANRIREVCGDFKILTSGAFQPRRFPQPEAEAPST